MMSILEATKCSLIRRGTAFELLEAQAASGKIIDVQSGKSISLETAFNTNVIDREYEDVVRRAYRAVVGYREPFKRQVLSLCEAMSRHLVFEKHAIRLLEAQLATGGIVDIKSPVRISADVAAKRGLLDSTLADKLGSKQTKSYFDPVTGENLNYSELMGRCVLDRDSNLLFLMVEGGTVTGNIRPFEPQPEGKRIRVEEQLANVRLKVVKAKRKKKSKRKKKKRSSSASESSSSSRPTSPAFSGDSRPTSPSILSRKVVIVDPVTGEELSIHQALAKELIDRGTADELLAQEGEFTEESTQNLPVPEIVEEEEKKVQDAQVEVTQVASETATEEVPIIISEETEVVEETPDVEKAVAVEETLKQVVEEVLESAETVEGAAVVEEAAVEKETVVETKEDTAVAEDNNKESSFVETVKEAIEDFFDYDKGEGVSQERRSSSSSSSSDISEDSIKIEENEVELEEIPVTAVVEGAAVVEKVVEEAAVVEQSVVVEEAAVVEEASTAEEFTDAVEDLSQTAVV